MQNERYEEWNNTLRLLRKLFKHYLDYVLRYHHQQWPNWKIPTARNSTAARGNFLETLNMSLNCEWGGGLPQVSQVATSIASAVTTKVCLSQETFCHEKQILCRDKMFCFNIILS